MKRTFSNMYAFCQSNRHLKTFAGLEDNNISPVSASQPYMSKVIAHPEYTCRGSLYQSLEDGRVSCLACAHRCRIAEGHSGICEVRHNINRILMVPYGYVSALNDDPIEKKPFYHLYPGMNVMSFGMLGCNFVCGFCQNWNIAQGFEDDRNIVRITPEEICDMAESRGTRAISSTYNEPLITSEWAVSIAKEAKKRGMNSFSFVSNGHATPEAVEYISPWIDSFKVDLKSFNSRTYTRLGGKLDKVCETIQLLHKKGFWVEVVTLIVPGMNDSEEELKRLAEFLMSVSPDIPWHVTAFHPDYKFLDARRTPASTIIKAVGIGKEMGLNFVYPGNISGLPEGMENTYCSECGAMLVKRHGFYVDEYLIEKGCCPECGINVPGKWW